MEKRQLKRRHLVYYLDVFDVDTDKLIGRLVDITTEGIMLISEEPIETGVDFQLRLILPVELEGSKDIVFSARSLWCKKDINPDFYDTGFQLLNFEPKYVRIIGRFVDEFGFRE